MDRKCNKSTAGEKEREIERAKKKQKVRQRVKAERMYRVTNVV